MSTEEQDQILSYLRLIRGLLVWLGGGVVLAICGLIAINITDHFDQIKLREQVNWMEPKVQQLWWRSPISSDGKL